MKRKTRYLSFGNQAAVTHGAARNGKRTKAYAVWISMRKRCRDKKDQWYGSQGVTVCKRWNQFENFLTDMGEPPTAKHQIDRIYCSKGYSKSNCRWATPSENALNRKTTRWITFNGERRSLSQWSDHTGIKLRTIKARIDYLKWPLEKALTKGAA